MEFSEFWTICSTNGIVLDKKQLDDFRRFHDELIYWNEKVNMISRKDYDNLLEKHFIHSLSILKYINPKKKARCLDIGTGGGFPGIPLKLARPDLHMLMIDSTGKKVKMAEMFAQHTGLKNISALKIRAEELAASKRYRGQFDYVFARAVTNTLSLIHWSKRILRPEGKIVLLKGGDLKDEIQEAMNDIRGLSVKEYDLNLLGVPSFKEDEKKLLVFEIQKKPQSDKKR